jgi:ankyrin repeat protein
VELLLNCGAEVDIENEYMKTPLHVSIHFSPEADWKIFHLLSISKAGIQTIKNEAKYESTRALRPELLIHLAAAQGSVDICKELVEKYKYNIEWKTYDGLTPLQVALMGRHLGLAKIMVTRWSAALPSEIGSFRAVIHALPASEDSLVEGFKLLTEAWGFNINASDHLGNTIFHDPNYDLIPVLRAIEICDLKIDWDKKNSLGQTFLHCNFNWQSDPVLLSTFLQHSQSGVNTCDLQGRSPISMYFITNLGLIISEKRGAVDVRTPLDFGADRYLADNEGRTALGVASSYLESIRKQNHPAESLIHIEESIGLWTNYSTVAIDVHQVDLQLNSKSSIGRKAEF